MHEKINGKIRVAFIITKEGEICDVRITSKPIKYIDDEFIRVFKIMPKTVKKRAAYKYAALFLFDWAVLSCS